VKLVVLDSRADGFQKNLLVDFGVCGGFRTTDPKWCSFANSHLCKRCMFPYVQGIIKTMGVHREIQ
jgi:hypothetical protein